jgi:hypothetical protein
MDNNTRAFFVRLIQANPGATDEKLRKAFLEQIRASPMGHVVNPRKLVDDGGLGCVDGRCSPSPQGARKRSRATRPAGQGP